MSDIKEFPNGFTNWHETHFDIVEGIRIDIQQHDKNGHESAATRRHDEQGSGGLYELAAEWTDEFELKYKGVNWGQELEYYDTVQEFLNQKLK